MEHKKGECLCKNGCDCGEDCSCQCCESGLGHRGRWFRRGSGDNHAGNAVYGIGMVGAFVYYMQNAHTFGGVLYGLLKAVLWPGFLIFEVMKYLHM